MSAHRVSFGAICEKKSSIWKKKGTGGERDGFGGGCGRALLLSWHLFWHMFCIRLIQIPWRCDKSVILSICFFVVFFLRDGVGGVGGSIGRPHRQIKKERREREKESERERKAKSVMSVL